MPATYSSGFLFVWEGHMKYDKPFKTYDEQIDILQNKYGVVVKDREFARNILISISYNDLINGFKSVLKKESNSLCEMTIEYLYELHLLDKSVQAFILKYGLFIENLFKNVMAYSIASSFGVDANKYLDSNNYQAYSAGSSFKENVLTQILPILKDKKYAYQPTKNYINLYNHIPPWILLKNISFGDAINLYNVLKKEQKEMVINLLFNDSNAIKYDQKVEILRNGLTNIRIFRNLAAHNLSFSDFRVTKSIQPKQLYHVLPGLIYLTEDLRQPLNIDKKACKGLYSVVLIILLLLNTNDLKSVFVTDFLNTVFQSSTSERFLLKTYLFNDYCKLTAMPKNLFERLHKYLKLQKNIV